MRPACAVWWAVALALAAPLRALVTCRDSCSRCRLRAGPPDLLEVYCSMCKECVLRRRQLLQRSGPARPPDYGERPPLLDSLERFATNPQSRRKGYNPAKYPVGCPTPPSCPESDENEFEEVQTQGPITSSTCPPITSCVKKPKKSTGACMPCVPICAGAGACHCGGSTAGATTTLDPLAAYVYVGVPPNVPVRRRLL